MIEKIKYFGLVIFFISLFISTIGLKVYSSKMLYQEYGLVKWIVIMLIILILIPVVKLLLGVVINNFKVTLNLKERRAK